MKNSWFIRNDYSNVTKILERKNHKFYIKEIDKRGVIINTIVLTEEEIRRLHAAMRQIDEY